MRVCTVSYKECWQDETGRWLSDGGFPLQVCSIASMFDENTLVIGAGARRAGGLPLPLDANVVTMRSPYGRDLRRKISVVLRMAEYLSTIVKHARKADVIHVPLPGDIPFLAMCVALVTRKRLLARYEGSWFPNSQTTLMNRVTRALLKRIAGGKRVVIATGEGASRPAPRIRWLFSTALTRRELERIQPVLERGVGDPPRLIYAGRLSSEKGVAVLVRAIQKLKEGGFTPLPQVTIAGDGPQRRELEELVDAVRCRDLVSFVGQLNRTDLGEAFRVADVCVQPSLSEGYSKAWLDAMAYGLPVISSRVGAASGVIGERQERGWLVEPGSENALAATIKEVLHGAVDWPTLRKRCRRYTEERTLETWTESIGRACAQSWNLRFVDGKLC
jgi:glycosyltransferase involved in cell wall biosynthesis